MLPKELLTNSFGYLCSFLLHFIITKKLWLSLIVHIFFLKKWNSNSMSGLRESILGTICSTSKLIMCICYLTWELNKFIFNISPMNRVMLLFTLLSEGNIQTRFLKYPFTIWHNGYYNSTIFMNSLSSQKYIQNILVFTTVTKNELCSNISIFYTVTFTLSPQGK